MAQTPEEQKEARRKINARYRKKHHKKIRAYQNERAAANPEATCIRTRDYVKNNPDRIKATTKKVVDSLTDSYLRGQLRLKKDEYPQELKVKTKTL
jgi:hypothetical protein